VLGINEMLDAGLLDDLMTQIDSEGGQLTGEGFLLQMIKVVWERGLAAKQTSRLGCAKGDPAGRASTPVGAWSAGRRTGPVSCAATCSPGLEDQATHEGRHGRRRNLWRPP
jgi:hypothetical protein